MTRRRNKHFACGALVVAGLATLPSLALARGSHSHTSGLMAPAAPSVPPSLTPDSRLTGAAPLPPAHAEAGKKGFEPARDPEDARVEKLIANICRGC
jgi:hypothetical protein